MNKWHRGAPLSFFIPYNNFSSNKGTMGTRSRIGIKLKDDSILSVYCHWDGYPSYNGRILRDNYNTVDKVRELIDGGNISALHTNAGGS